MCVEEGLRSGNVACIPRTAIATARAGEVPGEQRLAECDALSWGEDEIGDESGFGATRGSGYGGLRATLRCDAVVGLPSSRVWVRDALSVCRRGLWVWEASTVIGCRPFEDIGKVLGPGCFV